MMNRCNRNTPLVADGRVIEFERSLANLLEDRLALYKAYVPNGDILAAYIHETRNHLIGCIDRVFDAQLEDLARGSRGVGLGEL